MITFQQQQRYFSKKQSEITVNDDEVDDLKKTAVLTNKSSSQTPRASSSLWSVISQCRQFFCAVLVQIYFHQVITDQLFGGLPAVVTVVFILLSPKITDFRKLLSSSRV